MIDAVSKIIEKAGKEKTIVDKARVLTEQGRSATKTIIWLTYGDVEFDIPQSTPDYRASDLLDLDGVLYREHTKLLIFLKGHGYDHVKQKRKQDLFIMLLEDLHADDSKMLTEHVIKQRPFEGIPKEVIEHAYPNIKLKS